MGNTCLHQAHDTPHEPTPLDLAKKKIDRRTILKATAAFTAMAATTSLYSPKTRAQSVPTLANEWTQPEGIGGGSGWMGFEADFPFYAIAPHWPENVDFDAAVEVQISNDGVTYSDPVVLGPAHTDAGPTDRDNRVFGQLAFTEQSRFVRYRTLDANGEERSIPGLSFTYIDATGGPGLGDISTQSPVPSLDRPPIISREEWGASLAYGGTERGASKWIPEYETVEHVIIHHSETSNFRQPLSEIRSIHYYHAVTRGWGDIGYNYLVDFMGNVYEGRVGGDNVVGGHAYQYAYGSSGICTMGSYTLDEATPEALAGLIWITAWAARYLDPLGRSDFHEQANLPTICAHRDVNDSACPGDGLYADLGYIREAVAQVLAGARDSIPEPDYSPGQIVATTVEGANLREAPGLDGEVLREAPFGAVFQVIDGPTTVDDHVWYQLEGDTGWGWVATSTFAASDAAPPKGQYAIGDGVVIDTDLLNIRDTPTLRGMIVATLPYMAEGTITKGPMPANGYKWYQVQTELGTGWSAEQYLSLPGDVSPPSRFAIGEAIQVADPEGLRLRTAPSPDAQSVASLPIGTRGTVIAGPKAASGYIWMQIQTTLGTGWCAEEFLDYAPWAEPPAAKFGAGDYVVVDTDWLNLRAKPGVDESIITTLGTGMDGRIVSGPEVSDNLNWFKLETEHGTGWCVETFLAAEDAASTSRIFTVGSPVHVNTDWLNVRADPSTDGEVVTILGTNDSAKVVDGPVESEGYNWYRIEMRAGTGWSVAQYLAKGHADSSARSFSNGTRVFVDTDAINIRNDSSMSGDIVNVLFTNEVATVIGGPVDSDGYTWWNLRTDDGDGWGAGVYLAPSAGNIHVAGDTVRVFDGELNLRASGSLGAEVTAILPDAAYVDILEGPVPGDNYTWYRVGSTRYGSGWCVGEYLAST